MWVIILLKFLAVVLSFLFLLPFNAYAADNSAESAVVIDACTLTVLYEKNAYEERSMASTTKIMTALLAVESGRLEETVSITDEMVNVEGSALGLRNGDKLSFYDLTVGMMLTSGNDAANSVAYFLAGSIQGFAELMNTRAEEIGMKNTYFVTPSGLDENNHHSTAYDMALLSAQAVKYKEFCDICSKQSAEITINDKKLTVYNHNKLLAKDKAFYGIKTGFTEKSGRCLVTAKKYEGNDIICVTLSCPDDWNDHIRLCNEAESKYVKTQISNSISLCAVGGECETIRCTYSKEYYSLNDITVKEYYFPFVYADVSKGDIVGTACVYRKENLIERLPITADEDLKYAGQQLTETSEIYG